MKISLDWKEKDGVWVAQFWKFQFVIEHNPFTGWVSRIRKPDIFAIPRILLTDAKEECQSHADAISDAVEEAKKDIVSEETIKCECGCEVPLRFAQSDVDGVDLCPACYIGLIEELIPKWISVKERLPEIGQKVWVTWLYFGHQEQGQAYRSNYEPKEWCMFYAKFSPEVTHWMPLPEFQKEEGKC